MDACRWVQWAQNIQIDLDENKRILLISAVEFE